MANGYGSASSSGPSSGTGARAASTTSSSSSSGLTAPRGFHYMPDGTLMSDAEHARLYGTRTIRAFTLDLSDLPANGEIRNFDIIGDNDSEFKLEIKDKDTGKYYNFVTNLFQTTKTSLEEKITNRRYKGSVTFPSVTGNDDQYDIHLSAKHGTQHVKYIENRFGDGTVDLNGSTGSNSLLMQKVIYQYSDLTLTLTPYSTNSTIDVSNRVNDTLTVSRNRSKNKISFSISVSAPGYKNYQVIKQPSINDIISFVEVTVGSAPEYLPGEAVQSPEINYQWPVDDISKITPGMIVLGDNVTADSIVAKYEDTITIFENTKDEEIIIKNEAPALNTKGQKPTVVKGLVTVQPGNVVFNNQQVAGLADDTIKIGGYGASNILNIHGYELVFTDLAIALTTVTTTTTAAVVNSASIPVASVNGVIPGTTTVSGMGIDPYVADPIVDSTGVGILNLNATQNLESGVTLTFGGGGGQTATLTGNVEVIKAGTANATIRFDVERLLNVV